MSLVRLPFLWSVTWGVHTTMTPPNPTPPRSERVSTTGSERILRWIPVVAKVGGHWPAQAFFWMAAISETHAIITHNMGSISSSSPLRITAPLLIGWSLNLLGATLRRKCYRALGHSFTFVLSIRPNHKLITSGPYAYVRHPSYTGGIIAGIGTLFCHFSTGSWVSECFGPWLRVKLDIPSLSLNLFDMGWFGWSLSVGIVTVLLRFILRPRMRKEDEMLRKEFGKEWEEWQKRVPYWMIPGIY